MLTYHAFRFVDLLIGAFASIEGQITTCKPRTTLVGNLSFCLTVLRNLFVLAKISYLYHWFLLVQRIRKVCFIVT